MPLKHKRRPSVSRRLKIIMLACFTATAFLVLGAMFVAQQQRLVQAAAEAANFTPAPLEASIDTLNVGVIGDSYTGGSNEGGDPLREFNWVNKTEATLDEDGLEVRFNPAASGGSGYTSGGPSDTVFGELVPAAVQPGTDLIVFFGSINDIDQPVEQVVTDAVAAWADAKAIAPDAKLMVVGPAWPSADVPPQMLAIRDGLKSAASEAGATFVDPIAEGWFADAPELIGADGVHPTDDGHLLMAEKMTPHIRTALT